jgi:hypothetical protein
VKEERKAKDSSIGPDRDLTLQKTGEISRAAKTKTNKLPLRLRSTNRVVPLSGVFLEGMRLAFENKEFSSICITRSGLAFIKRTL